MKARNQLKRRSRLHFSLAPFYTEDKFSDHRQPWRRLIFPGETSASTSPFYPYYPSYSSAPQPSLPPLSYKPSSPSKRRFRIPPPRYLIPGTQIILSASSLELRAILMGQSKKSNFPAKGSLVLCRWIPFARLNLLRRSLWASIHFPV